VTGSTMLQMRLSVGSAMNGSITAVVGSGTTSMSEALIGCQPRIDEPSKPEPSSKSSSLSSLVGIVKCCQMPIRSRNLRSTASTLLSFANFSTSLGVCVAIPSPSYELMISAPGAVRGSDRVAASFARADADDLVDRENEDLAVADAARLGRLLDLLHHVRDLLVAHDDLELHLRQEVDDVLGAAIELGVSLLTPEPLHLAHRDALHADTREILLHLVELERFDDRLDLLHGSLRELSCAAAGPRFTRRPRRL